MLRIFGRMLLGVTVLAAGPIVEITAVRAAEGTTLVLGRITTEPRKHYDRLRTMADYLAAELADDGIAGVDVVMVESADKMAQFLRDGRVDIVSETPFVAFELADQGVATLLLREWKKGVAQYHSVIVARKNGPIKRISDLPGHRFAFEDPGSTSGYMLPRHALQAAGLELKALDDPRDPVPENVVGYSFAEGEINVMARVNRGLADAGAISNLDWEDPKTAPRRFRDTLMVIHETRPVVRSVLMVRATMQEAHKQLLSQVFQQMHESAAGRKTMKTYFSVARYDRLDGDALSSLETAREVWQQARGRPD